MDMKVSSIVYFGKDFSNLTIDYIERGKVTKIPFSDAFICTGTRFFQRLYTL
jgi:hypothetical protein